MIHPETPEDIKRKFYALERENKQLVITEDYDKYRIEIHEKLKPDIVYETRNDSDDMISPEAMGIYHRERGIGEWDECRFFEKGYYYNMEKQELHLWDYPECSSPQFLTYIIPAKRWAYDRDTWYKERGGGMHTMGRRFDAHKVLKGREILVLGNGTNASKQWQHNAGIVQEPGPVYQQFNITEELRDKWKIKCTIK